MKKKDEKTKITLAKTFFWLYKKKAQEKKVDKKLKSGKTQKKKIKN